MSKPANRFVDRVLFAGIGGDVERLNKASRKELRNKERLKYKNQRIAAQQAQQNPQ